MPPKAKYSREDIVNAAFNIAEAEGLDAISARKVADQLGCSVAPLYVNFSTLEELVAAVMEKINVISAEILASAGGHDVFEKLGRASLTFAREYPVLFRDLVLRPNSPLKNFGKAHDDLAEVLAADRELGKLGFEDRRRLFLKMQIFQTGLQVMIANGLTPAWLSPEEAEDLLMETGQELLEAEFRKNN